jgi:hypothetical protein
LIDRIKTSVLRQSNTPEPRQPGEIIALQYELPLNMGFDFAQKRGVHPSMRKTHV